MHRGDRGVLRAHGPSRRPVFRVCPPHRVVIQFAEDLRVLVAGQLQKLGLLLRVGDADDDGQVPVEVPGAVDVGLLDVAQHADRHGGLAVEPDETQGGVPENRAEHASQGGNALPVPEPDEGGDLLDGVIAHRSDEPAFLVEAEVDVLVVIHHRHAVLRHLDVDLHAVRAEAFGQHGQLGAVFRGGQMVRAPAARAMRDDQEGTRPAVQRTAVDQLQGTLVAAEGVRVVTEHDHAACGRRFTAQRCRGAVAARDARANHAGLGAGELAPGPDHHDGGVRLPAFQHAIPRVTIGEYREAAPGLLDHGFRPEQGLSVHHLVHPLDQPQLFDANLSASLQFGRDIDVRDGHKHFVAAGKQENEGEQDRQARHSSTPMNSSEKSSGRSKVEKANQVW